jgi:cytochrome c
MNITSAKRMAAIAAAAGLLISFGAFADEPIDEEAAIALARREDCLKCHSVDRKKDGPSYKSVASKYKNKPDAEEKLLKHITTGPIVRTGDEENEHRIPKTKDEKELRNIIRWILSR